MSELTSRELSEWLAFYNLEPFGDAQEEYRAAMITSMVANTARDEKKKAEPFQARDFIREGYLGEEEVAQEQLVEKIQTVFGGMTALHKRSEG